MKYYMLYIQYEEGCGFTPIYNRTYLTHKEAELDRVSALDRMGGIACGIMEFEDDQYDDEAMLLLQSSTN